MIVVDTSVWIDHLRGLDLPHVRVLKELASGDILLGDVVLLEVLRGEDTEARASRLTAELRAFTGARMLGIEVATEAARNYRTLRRLGITVRSMADTIIATYCILHDRPLLHNDRDFDAFETHLGLEVFRPH
jgi:predicted nucleic acid-binding protein